MDTNPQFQATLDTLEQVMVRQFNLLQELLSLTRAERDALYRNDTTLLMPLVERKEALLDQIVLLEDQRRMETERLVNTSGQELAKRFRYINSYHIFPHRAPSASSD